MPGPDGAEHKFKVVCHKDGTITRTIDGQKGTTSIIQNGDNKVEYSTFKHVTMQPDTVVDPEAKAANSEYISQKLDKLRGVLTTKENGKDVTYSAVTDGDTKKDFIIRQEAGKDAEIKAVKDASHSLKMLAENARGTR